jgi:hypothetical protein
MRMRVNWKWVVPILAMGLGLVLVAFAQGHSIREDRLAALLLPALYVASGLALLIGTRWGHDLLIVLAIGSLALLLPSLVAPRTMSAISGLITLTVGNDHLITVVKEIIFSICALACAIFANRALPGSDDSSKWSLLLRWTRFPPVVLFVACILWGIALTLVSVLWAHFGYLRYVASEDLPSLLEKYIDSFKANYSDYGYHLLLVPSVVTWIFVIAPLFYFSPRILRRFSLPPIVSSSILTGAILGASGTSAAYIIGVWQSPETTQFIAALLGAVPFFPHLMTILVGLLGYLLGGVAGWLVGYLLLFPIRSHEHTA